MSDPADLIEISLQILFGLLGFLLAILAIHYRDSLCSVLLRRWRRRQEPDTTCKQQQAPVVTGLELNVK
jgi:hypothetical protein